MGRSANLTPCFKVDNDSAKRKSKDTPFQACDTSLVSVEISLLDDLIGLGVIGMLRRKPRRRIYHEYNIRIKWGEVDETLRISGRSVIF
jgi:hypothetical protein